MPAKKKKEKAAPQAPTPPAVFQSVAASEHATEGSTSRKVVDLPGMVGEGVEKPHYPELDDAVVLYVKERDLRIKHGITEKTQKKLILALMEAKSLGSYEVDDMVVVKKPKDDTASIKVVALADYSGDKGSPGSDENEDD